MVGIVGVVGMGLLRHFFHGPSWVVVTMRFFGPMRSKKEKATKGMKVLYQQNCFGCELRIMQLSFLLTKQ